MLKLTEADCRMSELSDARELKFRLAKMADVPLLAGMNRQLVEDERHRNRFKSDQWFEERMAGFLSGTYDAVLFELSGEVVAYALYTNHPGHSDTIYLRQIFVDRAHRKHGIGRQAMQILEGEIWPKEKRLTVEALAHNRVALDFYRSVGFREYSIELEIAASDRSAR
jgi:ribosomal protein S18 acetylase RimI-like enzyme